MVNRGCLVMQIKSLEEWTTTFLSAVRSSLAVWRDSQGGGHAYHISSGSTSLSQIRELQRDPPVLCFGSEGETGEGQRETWVLRPTSEVFQYPLFKALSFEHCLGVLFSEPWHWATLICRLLFAPFLGCWTFSWYFLSLLIFCCPKLPFFSLNWGTHHWVTSKLLLFNWGKHNFEWLSSLFFFFIISLVTIKKEGRKNYNRKEAGEQVWEPICTRLWFCMRLVIPRWKARRPATYIPGEILMMECNVHCGSKSEHLTLTLWTVWAGYDCVRTSLCVLWAPPLPAVTIANVSRCCQMSSGGQSCPSWEPLLYRFGHCACNSM